MIGLWILLAHLAGLTAATSHNNIRLEDLPYRLKDRVDHRVAGHAFVPAHTLVVDDTNHLWVCNVAIYPDQVRPPYGSGTNTKVKLEYSAGRIEAFIAKSRLSEIVVAEPKPDALPLSHLAVVSGFSDDGTPYTD